MSDALDFSVTIVFPRGEPEGPRVIEQSNWTGKGLVFSRSRFVDVRDRKELKQPGVYVLWGPGNSGKLPSVYVGEGDVLLPRLEAHHKNKKNKRFWTDGVAFTSETLNKAHVKYLEARLVELAHEAKRCALANTKRPQKPSLSSADEANAKQYLENMLLCLLAVGVSFFERPRGPESRDLEDKPVQPQGMSSRLALLQGVTDWNTYRGALEQCDQLWADYTRGRFSVLGETGWFRTISDLHKVVKQDWRQFGDDTGKCLLGLRDECALLGRMRHKAFTVIFRNEHNCNTVQKAVRHIVAADNSEFPDVAIEAYEMITGIRDLSTATATRLLALARPDQIVSFNRASRNGLTEYCNLKLSEQISAEKYRSVLDRLYQQPWFNAPPPENLREHAIWSMRAALVDCFVYKKSTSPGP